MTTSRCGARRGAKLLSALVAVSWLAMAGVGYTQTLNCDCGDSLKVLTDDRIGLKWLDLHPRTIERDVAPLRALGRWSEAVDVISERFARRAVFLAQPDRVVLLKAIETARTSVADLESRPGGRTGGTPAPQAWFSVHLTGDQDGYETLGGVPPSIGGPIVVGDETPMEARRATCWTAVAMQQLLSHMNESGRDQALIAVRARYDRWENYARYGYTQFPLELVINGLREERARRRDRSLEPPRRQWIVLHPSAGAELAVADEKGKFVQPKDWIETQAVVLEAAGILIYGSGRRNYMGVSGIVTFPGGHGIGVGGLLHINRDFKAGVVYHGDTPKRMGVLASVDLRRWLAGTPQGVQELLNRAKQEVLSHYSEEASR